MIQIDTATRRFRYRSVNPFHRAAEGTISDDFRIVIQSRQTVNFVGDPVRVGVAWLDDGARRRRFLKGDLESVTSRAYDIAGRLRIPVETESDTTAVRRTARVVTWSTWSAMIAVIVAMLWPALSGSRPIRFSDWNQRWSDSIQQSPAERAFQDGVRAYARADYKESEQRFRDAMRERPKNAEAMNMLAYALAGQKRLDDALGMANDALAAAPRSGFIADTVAEMHQRRGEFEQAARMYEEALKLEQPGDVTETQTKYGETLLALGRRTEGLKMLSSAIRLGRDRWAARAREVLAGKVKDFRNP